MSPKAFRVGQDPRLLPTSRSPLSMDEGCRVYEPQGLVTGRGKAPFPGLSGGQGMNTYFFFSPINYFFFSKEAPPPIKQKKKLSVGKVIFILTNDKRTPDILKAIRRCLSPCFVSLTKKFA